MFDIASTELLLVVLIALVVIGPKDLPKLLRFVGNWVGKARSVMAQFRLSIDEMVRESELKELEEKWKKQNEEIMRDYPPAAPPEEVYADLDMALEHNPEPEAEPVQPAPKKPAKKPAARKSKLAKATKPAKPAKPGTKPA